ncbi:crossover junction endodeoxyribonuclease RuvC [Limisphaera sp. 4302-co]|uniref:crossover junction endodeoxyribonuclease RuvC n=1 Tax=Limisphaera sp. 4302-co TaxID=3400417 RepID=UPI003C2A99B4
MGISLRDYARMEARLRQPATQTETGSGPTTTRHEGVVIGVDPSLRGTGYGLVARKGSDLQVLAYGTVRCPRTWSRTECLAAISRTLRQLVETHHPTVAVFEGLFHARNVRTALIMGEARGAALSVLAEAGIEIYEIAPRRVKLAVTGHGGADKPAVARMVRRLLNLNQSLHSDEADALALALTHWQTHARPWAGASKRI